MKKILLPKGLCEMFGEHYGHKKVILISSTESRSKTGRLISLYGQFIYCDVEYTVLITFNRNKNQVSYCPTKVLNILYAQSRKK